MFIEFKNQLETAHQYGVVYTPEIIDSDAFQQLITLIGLAQGHHKKPTLVITCAGGNPTLGRAVYDMLRENGTWTGYLMGSCESAGIPLFLGCKIRYVNLHGFMGIHQPKSPGNQFLQDVLAQADYLNTLIEQMAFILYSTVLPAYASKYSVEYFENILKRCTDETHRYHAIEMVKLGFAHEIKAFNGSQFLGLDKER